MFSFAIVSSINGSWQHRLCWPFPILPEKLASHYQEQCELKSPQTGRSVQRGRSTMSLTCSIGTQRRAKFRL
ncbi:hypothetical protein JG687_00017735 [Phytophthora cactorum]|uniref:Uncharacterized protein n=1 Tax=Phytophthora cactorum TaxID=29920 RepID=A0A8T1TQM8_9STRA|nr:hypothetical protein GQ600_18084 [Phytophthora cactorum]KAG6944662.1 hypothetical protein JG687_00017735 [Phytophthora cactorum]